MDAGSAAPEGGVGFFSLPHGTEYLGVMGIFTNYRQPGVYIIFGYFPPLYRQGGLQHFFVDKTVQNIFSSRNISCLAPWR
jgi:hypothetical protein